MVMVTFEFYHILLSLSLHHFSFLDQTFSSLCSPSRTKWHSVQAHLNHSKIPCQYYLVDFQSFTKSADIRSHFMENHKFLCTLPNLANQRQPRPIPAHSNLIISKIQILTSCRQLSNTCSPKTLKISKLSGEELLTLSWSPSAWPESRLHRAALTLQR